MNDFFTAQHFLINQIQADPLLSLAYTVSTLDPLWNSADDFYAPEHETDALYIALHILRRPFPELYFDTLGAIQAGKPYDHIESMICQSLQSHGILLDDLEWIGYGIPLPAYGVEWDHPDFTTSYPEALPLLACFGVTLETEYTISDELRETVQRITETLSSDQDKRWQQVGWAIQWLFSCTGNSSVDYSEEILSEFQPLAWDTDDIAFAREIIKEAEQIMGDVWAGLTYLADHPEAYLKLTDLIQGEDHAKQSTPTSPPECDERTAQLVA